MIKKKTLIFGLLLGCSFQLTTINPAYSERYYGGGNGSLASEIIGQGIAGFLHDKVERFTGRVSRGTDRLTGKMVNRGSRVKDKVLLAKDIAREIMLPDMVQDRANDVFYGRRSSGYSRRRNSGNYSAYGRNNDHYGDEYGRYEGGYNSDGYNEGQYNRQASYRGSYSNKNSRYESPRSNSGYQSNSRYENPRTYRANETFDRYTSRRAPVQTSNSSRYERPIQSPYSQAVPSSTPDVAPTAYEPRPQYTRRNSYKRQYNTHYQSKHTFEVQKLPSEVLSKDAQIQKSILEASRKTKLPVGLLSALIKKESSFNPKAVSRSGAKGLTQLMPSTALSECELAEYELFDIDKNIQCGASYLAKQVAYFGQYDLALAAYNAGPGAVRRAIKKVRSRNIHKVTSVLKSETRPYVQKILADMKSYDS